MINFQFTLEISNILWNTKYFLSKYEFYWNDNYQLQMLYCLSNECSFDSVTDVIHRLYVPQRRPWFLVGKWFFHSTLLLICYISSLVETLFTGGSVAIYFSRDFPLQWVDGKVSRNWTKPRVLPLVYVTTFSRTEKNLVYGLKGISDTSDWNSYIRRSVRSVSGIYTIRLRNHNSDPYILGIRTGRMKVMWMTIDNWLYCFFVVQMIDTISTLADWHSNCLLHFVCYLNWFFFFRNKL